MFPYNEFYPALCPICACIGIFGVWAVDLPLFVFVLLLSLSCDFREGQLPSFCNMSDDLKLPFVFVTLAA